MFYIWVYIDFYPFYLRSATTLTYHSKIDMQLVAKVDIASHRAHLQNFNERETMRNKIYSQFLYFRSFCYFRSSPASVSTADYVTEFLSFPFSVTIYFQNDMHLKSIPNSSTSIVSAISVVRRHLCQQLIL